MTTNTFAESVFVEPNLAGNATIKLHSGWKSINGTRIRVGAMVGVGNNTGNIFEINDCSPGDAACWYVICGVTRLPRAAIPRR